jgi:uncharacterized protein (TIGR02266 family)
MIPVDYSAVDAFFTEFTANINEGGIFVQSDTRSEIGTEVQLQFHLPGRQEPLDMTGRVAWLSDGKSGSPEGMGIEFTGLNAEVREEINEVVRQLKTSPGRP